MAKFKIKTHKGASKRFWKTKAGKLTRRQATQDHFNARETGIHTRNKRITVPVAHANKSRINKLIPYA